MKIPKIINSLKAARTKNLKERKLERLNQNIRIHDKNTYGDSYKQMMDAREIIANYVQPKGVTVDIFDAKRLIENDDTAPSTIQDYMADKINVVVTNILNGKFENKIISANTDKTYPKMAQTHVMIHLKDDGLEVIKHGYRQTSDSFLRNLYRSIEELTRKVTSNKEK